MYGSVSIPYRKAENETSSAFQELAERVSIPYRKAENFTHHDFVDSQYTVSIPYRKAENRYNGLRRFANIRFQFLIGRLKTNHAIDDTLSCSKFQFLIGRLKTRRLFLAILV